MLKIVTYSDLHLEFDHGWNIPADLPGDVLVLAGDIVSFMNPAQLAPLLKRWGNRPVLFVAGNHEFYNAPTMGAGIENFQHWLLDYPNVSFLQDEPITIAGVNFFGGTMWTDFAGGNQDAMAAAQNYMNDYRIIHSKEGAVFTPEDSVALHQRFVDNLSRWFEDNLSGKRIVISHHAPVLKQGSIYAESPLVPAFTSLDMVPLIERYKPDLWIYGHTHECDRQRVGGTDILSNQLGYRNGLGGFECVDFDKFGKLSEIV